MGLFTEREPDNKKQNLKSILEGLLYILIALMMIGILSFGSILLWEGFKALFKH